MVIDVTRKV